MSITLEIAAGVMGVTENIGSKVVKTHDVKIQKNTKVTIFKIVAFYNIIFENYSNIYE